MCYSKYCDGGDNGGGWEPWLLARLAHPLWLHGNVYGGKVTMNDWVCVPGLALHASRWFAIYRLLNIFRMAGRRDTLSLPTTVHVERDGFSPPSPSTRPGGLPQILDSVVLICRCILTGTISTVPEQCYSTKCVLMFCLHFAGQVWSLAVPRDLPVLGAGGHMHACAVLVHVHPCMHAAPRGAVILATEYPQTAGFSPKSFVLATEELCVELQSLVCRLMEVWLLLPPPSSPLVALTEGSGIFL